MQKEQNGNVLNNRTSNHIGLFAIICIMLLCIGVMGTLLLTQYESSQKEYAAQETALKEASIEAMRITKINQIPSENMDKMIQYTTDYITAQNATPSKAIVYIHNDLGHKYEKNILYMTSYNCDESNSTVNSQLYEAILLSRKDDPTKGMLQLVFKTEMDLYYASDDLPHIQEVKYSACYYELNLTGGDTSLLTDYNNFSDNHYDDLDYDNWYNQSINTLLDKWSVIDTMKY